MIRLLAALLIALAISFAPLATRAGAAMAPAAPADHARMTMQMDHCPDQSGQTRDGKTGGKDCCIALCVAFAFAGAPSEPPLRFSRGAPRPSSDRFRPGFLARLPTPPPRRV